MSNSLLGIGWNFPVGPLALADDRVPETPLTGTVAQAAYEDSVRQSIQILLGTAPGERAMRPDFGCGIHDLVFTPGTAGAAGLLTDEVRRALLQWEPRIDVRAVTVTPQASGERLLIRISYQVRTTNNVFNLVYPFHLDRGAP